MTKNQIAWEELQEKIRSNKAQEGETYRSNVAREANSAEANRIAANQVALGYAQIAQKDRQLAYDKQQDAREYELATWDMYYANKRASETQRSNVARESETERHNRATETASYITAGTRAVSTGAQIAGKVAGLVSQTARVHQFSLFD
jgi:hypothetical protein